MRLALVLRAGSAVGLAMAVASCSGKNRNPQRAAQPASPELQVTALAGAAQPATIEAGGGVVPGIHPYVVYGDRRNPYADDPAAAEAGRRLFTQYNCAGCHGSHAGGGMGPSLRDSLWIYGNSDVQLFSSIIEGRSAGMPAWGAKLPESQIWQLISYIRTLNTPGEPEPPPKGMPEVKLGNGIGQPPQPPS
jgi:mono/diheme cytochrome c family protein